MTEATRAALLDAQDVEIGKATAKAIVKCIFRVSRSSEPLLIIRENRSDIFSLTRVFKENYEKRKAV